MNLYKIDLHTLRHEDARRSVIRFIEEHWNEPTELEIVTGNSIIMKNIVIEVLGEYNLPYQIGRAFDLHNRGYIITWTD